MRYQRILFLLLLWVSTACASASEVQATKNKHPVSKSIPIDQVVWMYTMKTRFWPDGTKITVVYQENTSVHAKFCSEVLAITSTRYQQLVSAYINNGNAAYFKKVGSANSMLTTIALTDGSIGYLDSETVVINKGVGHVEILRIAR